MQYKYMKSQINNNINHTSVSGSDAFVKVT